MDGVRKKAKYLHDAPTEALMPGIGGNYPHLNGTVAVQLPGQVPQTVSLGPQGPFYTQAPAGNYAVYAPHSSQSTIAMPESAVAASFGNQQTPISPHFSQNNQTMQNMAASVSQGTQPEMRQFNAALFDPSDPALFNLDIQNLNWGNSYGAMEFTMMGHLSSSVAETQERENGLLNPLNQAASEYAPQLASGAFNDPQGMAMNPGFAPDTLPNTEWPPSRNGSIHIQTPNNTPITATIDTLRHDILNNNAHAYAIGQGPSSLSSASPASTDVTSGYDNDNPMSSASFFAGGTNQQRIQQHPSPHPNRQQHEQNRRVPNTALQPIHPNTVRKRHRDTSSIYETIKEPYQYVPAFHRLRHLIETRFSKIGLNKMMKCLASFRPLLMAGAAEQDRNDLVQNEQNLQRQLLTIEGMIAEMGTPILVCRRSGEVVLMGNEFIQLTGWPRDVLLGRKPNLNVNFGPQREVSNDSGTSSRNSRTPMMAGQDSDPGPHPVSIVELMDENSVIQFFDDYSKLAFGDARGSRTRRVKLLKYRTKEDIAKLAEVRTEAMGKGQPLKSEQSGVGDSSDPDMQTLGERLGVVDCMIWWHIKRDIHDMPALILIGVCFYYPPL